MTKIEELEFEIEGKEKYIETVYEKKQDIEEELHAIEEDLELMREKVSELKWKND